MSRHVQVPDRVLKSGDPSEVADWFLKSQGADSVTRRHHVWSLLAWYHLNVRSQYTFRAWLKRLWYRLTFRPQKAQLYRPFQEYVDILAKQRRDREKKAELEAQLKVSRGMGRT